MNALGKLGLIHFCLEDYAKAVEYFQQGLNIARTSQDRLGESIHLKGLGLVYYFLKNHTKAIEFYEQNLILTRQICDYQGEEKALIELISTYSSLGDYDKAIGYNQQHLALVQANQAKLYQRLGDCTLALESCDRALSIATELGIPLAKECQELKEKLQGRISLNYDV